MSVLLAARRFIYTHTQLNTNTHIHIACLNKNLLWNLSCSIVFNGCIEWYDGDVCVHQLKIKNVHTIYFLTKISNIQINDYNLRKNCSVPTISTIWMSCMFLLAICQKPDDIIRLFMWWKYTPSLCGRPESMLVCHYAYIHNSTAKLYQPIRCRESMCKYM